MKRHILSASVLLLGAGAVQAKSNLTAMLGTDVMFDMVRGVLSGIPATGSLPAMAACPGISGIVYNGTGSGNGANAMKSGAQEIAAMVSPLSTAQACTGIAAPLPTLGQEAEGVVVALDSVAVAAHPGNDSSCGGLAYSAAGGATLTPATCTEAGCVNGKYVPADERDYLRVLYFGIHGGLTTTTRNCNSDVRKELVAQFRNVFQAQSTCAATGPCANKPLRHAYRPEDGSVATQAFAAVVGIPSIYGGYQLKVYSSGFQTSNGFCNAGDVGTDHLTKGIHLGYDDSESPRTGPNWNTIMGESDHADLDPIRTPCDIGDQVCGADGTNGLVQVIAPPPVDSAFNYPTDDCDAGSVDLVAEAGPYVGYFGRCGDGSPALVGGCVIGYKTCSAASPCANPGAAPLTTGRSFLCVQPSAPGVPGMCWLGAPHNGEECRGANNWMRKVDGTLVTENSLGPDRPVLGAFFRKHVRAPGPGGNGTCQSSSSTGQLGCLVGVGEACSIGFGGISAVQGAGALAEGLSIKGIAPTKVNVQNLLSNDDAAYFHRYTLSRKLYVSSIIGFGSSFNTTGDTTGNGASGDELNLAKCLASPSYQPYFEARYGFVALPSGAVCEDFVEFRRCSGGLRPGKKCTSDSDCTGAGFVTDGTCPTTAACAGVTAENDACANNPVGIPR